MSLLEVPSRIVRAGAPDWWSAYGSFTPGENGLPHAGQVIRMYRKRKGWSAERLAHALDIEKRMVYYIEGSLSLPEPYTRRQMLVGLLSIPPALLGVLELAALPEHMGGMPLQGRVAVLPKSAVRAYEEVLVLAWESYYMSSAQNSASAVTLWLSHLGTSAKGASGIAADQLRALQCRFHQLSGVIGRDRLDFKAALADARKGLTLAESLGNGELIASSLHRRARAYVEMKRYDLAVKDLERALPWARQSRDPLRSYVLICLAEAYSLHVPDDVEKRKQSLDLLDEVGKTVRAARGDVLVGDGSFTRVDAPGLLMVRGDVLRRFHRLEDAQNALSMVGNLLPRGQTRWQGNLLVAEAQLSWAEGDVTSCSEVALDALTVMRETKSASNRAKIVELYRDMYVKDPIHSGVRELGQRLQVDQPVRKVNKNAAIS